MAHWWKDFGGVDVERELKAQLKRQREEAAAKAAEEDKMEEEERRVDPEDGAPEDGSAQHTYTRDQFIDFYGVEEGAKRWKEAAARCGGRGAEQVAEVDGMGKTKRRRIRFKPKKIANQTIKQIKRITKRLKNKLIEKGRKTFKRFRKAKAETKKKRSKKINMYCKNAKPIKNTKNVRKFMKTLRPILFVKQLQNKAKTRKNKNKDKRKKKNSKS